MLDPLIVPISLLAMELLKFKVYYLLYPSTKSKTEWSWKVLKHVYANNGTFHIGQYYLIFSFITS